jgi:hypothetical protein
MPEGLLHLVDAMRGLVDPYHEGVAQVVDGVERRDPSRRVQLPDDAAEVVKDSRGREVSERKPYRPICLRMASEIEHESDLRQDNLEIPVLLPAGTR